jgi:preprotein translocase SecE subunit
VTWPSRQDALSLTIIVLITVLVSSLVFGGCDFLFAQLFSLIIGLK